MALPRLARLAGFALFAAAAGLAHAGCASHSRGVPIEARPTPPQPGVSEAGTQVPADRPAATPEEPSASDPRASLRSRVVADTIEVRRMVSRCSATALLPEQEASVDALRDLLRRTRVALVGQDLARAESLARQARQLASSLDCGD